MADTWQTLMHKELIEHILRMYLAATGDESIEGTDIQ
jgi:hypothetical protein